MANERKTLDQILPDDIKNAGYGDLKAFFGKPVTIYDVTFIKRNDAWKATFTVSLVGDTAKRFLNTSSMQPMKVGKYLLQNKLFPVDAKFITQGQPVLLVDPDKEWTPEAPEVPDF